MHDARGRRAQCPLAVYISTSEREGRRSGAMSVVNEDVDGMETRHEGPLACTPHSSHSLDTETLDARNYVAANNLPGLTYCACPLLC